ncbi:cyclopropane-fatty-acyl-phospholipid synthase family protein [Mesonia sp. HuA40]|uniref:SAM-dependent methyltransferase n=1 Tax=Mesonia sp. HuA40 TaxID=2602761 RepID=UPI0011CBFE37|nr:class I SAM-dependent methyltransferase [Mesonia sp. HuA40]TXK71039.1 class I SAM-dependent methyltransferase [Mesonia sp. HuA40]
MRIDDKKWYAHWFDTPHYHKLYKHRDEKEAAFFMNNLVEYLGLKRGTHILDVACGRGRHANFLNKIGLEVTAIDLSYNNIAFAEQYANESLHFKRQDMRLALPAKFDAIFNLFTSFGYFEDDEDNEMVLKAFKEQLKPKACAVIDFVNKNHVQKNLIKEETKRVEEIIFHIKRRIDSKFIYKDISFESEGQYFHFTERVRAFELVDFKHFFNKLGLNLVNVFGDYQLNTFDVTESPRMILIVNLADE